jgi:TetR/AcrR family transcriptional regulator, transcriptional repressor for nem operon
MPRVSRAQAERNHQRVIDEAARLVRESGTGGVSIPQVMNAAGMTHGGFYKRFASKDELVALAARAAFAERLTDLVDAPAADTPSADSAATRRRFLQRYLSTAHRDHPGAGCAAVALAADSARAGSGDPLREAYVDGLRQMVDALVALGSDEPAVLVDLATVVGAVVLARATAENELSEEILAAVRARVLDGPDAAAASAQG